MAQLTVIEALKLGVAAHARGDNRKSLVYLNAVLNAHPDHPDANHNVGVVYVGMGKFDAAIQKFERAIQSNPKVDQFWFSLLDVLIKADRTTDAQNVMNRAKQNGVRGAVLDKYRLKLFAPDTYSSRFNHDPSKLPLDHAMILGKLMADEDYEKVVNMADNLLDLFPKSAELHGHKGKAFMKSKLYDAAIDSFQQAVQLDPMNGRYHLSCGDAYRQKEYWAEALQCYERALECWPKNSAIQVAIANVFYKQDDMERALEYLHAALRSNSQNVDALNFLAIISSRRGNMSEARSYYEEAIEINPKMIVAHYNLTRMIKYKGDEPHIAQMLELEHDDTLDEESLCQLKFSIAKALEDAGAIEQAFKYYLEGNSLRSNILGYNIQKHYDEFEKIRKKTVELVNVSFVPKKVDNHVVPIFVIGLPRSGTSLLQQIISSHAEVEGAGELDTLGREVTPLLNETKVTSQMVRTIRQNYLEHIGSLANGKRYVVDKMPDNFKFVNFIRSAFPEAKIVHIKRDIRATLWSNFKTHFTTTALGYCYDLKNLREYYKLYRNLMKYWNEKYPNKIITVNYEDLTENAEVEIKDLIRKLGLEWDENCLSPEKNKKVVATASILQVREKIYKGSSDEWRKFEPYLNGAFDNLS